MIRADPASGLGKPEKLKHNLQGLWSRRLSQKDRLIYKFDDDYLYIFAIGEHSRTLQWSLNMGLNDPAQTPCYIYRLDYSWLKDHCICWRKIYTN